MRLQRPRDVQQYLGKTITDVRVEVAGVPVAEPAVLELVETRVGEPLGDAATSAARSIIWSAWAGSRTCACSRPPADQGVALRWQLIPVKRITKITRDRHRPCCRRRRFAPSSPSGSARCRRPTASTRWCCASRRFYAERGFERASILPRIEDDEPAPELSELVLTIDAGERVTVGATAIAGTPLEAEGRGASACSVC